MIMIDVISINIDFEDFVQRFDHFEHVIGFQFEFNRKTNIEFFNQRNN